MSTGALFDYPTVIKVPMAATEAVVADSPAEVAAPRRVSVEASGSAVSTTIAESGRETPQPASYASELARVETQSFAFDKAQTIARARDCAGLTLESQSESGAMYSMYCATGRELLLCSGSGCRIAD